VSQLSDEQMEAIEHAAVDVANVITPILMKEPQEVIGAALGKVVAAWIARYRLGDEKYADRNQRAHEGRATILTRWMVGVMAEVEVLMMQADAEIEKERKS
jgi:phage gp36-like protein